MNALFYKVALVTSVVVTACAPQGVGNPASTGQAAVATAPAPSPKSDYPTKPVSLVTGFAAGGPLDLVARALVEAARPYFPQPIVIEYKPGASGAIGVTEVLQAKPDGYTLGMNGGGQLISPYTSQVAYKGPDDWRTITMTTEAPIVFAVLGNAPWKTMPELVAYAKANPGKIRVGVSGLATPTAFAIGKLNALAGINLTIVPFPSAAEASTAFLGAHVEALSLAATPFVGRVQDGSVRFLATYEEKRNPKWSGTPTVKELGYDFTFGAYHFVFGPKNLPDGIVATLDSALHKAVESDGFKKFAEANGYTVMYRGPADGTAYLKKDDAVVADMVKALGLGKK